MAKSGSKKQKKVKAKRSNRLLVLKPKKKHTSDLRLVPLVKGPGCFGG